MTGDRRSPIIRGVRRVVLLAVLLAGLVGAAGRSPALAAGESPIGAHSMLQLDDPLSFMQAMFEQAVAMNASSIRVDVAPALIFGNLARAQDYSGLDELVGLARQYHLHVVADLVTIPWWLADCQTPTPTAAMDRCGTDQLSEYQSLIGQIVSHADPVIQDWEIWNEPDTTSSFTGTPQQYALMLRAAYTAVKAVNPADDVLFGGISSPAGESWLGQVFATPGADAAQAFDIANVHERGDLDGLAADIAGWKQFLAANGFTGPLWVTEHGYPSDPSYQYDPGYAAGPASQASYLAASIPTLLDAGAAEVFVTERDNGTGEFASEGVLGGDVLDPPVADPGIVAKPSLGVVTGIAGCYAALGRDCPGPPPAAAPAALALSPTRLHGSGTGAITVSDPGPGPLALGAATLAGVTGGPAPPSLGVDANTCSGQLLEPNETCVVSIRFSPVSGGAASALLTLPSDSGSLTVPVTAVAPSVSSLASDQPMPYVFVLADGADGVGYPQRLTLALRNPLSAAVGVIGAGVSGADVRRFRVTSDTCAHRTLQSGAGCRLAVLFTPTRAGTGRAVLTLRGAGAPLLVQLRATASALPRVTRLTVIGATAQCTERRSGARLLVASSQAAEVRWTLTEPPLRSRRTLRAPSHRCALGPPPRLSAGRLSAGRRLSGGRSQTSGHPIVTDGAHGFIAQVPLRAAGARGSLGPGTYVMTVTAINRHGVGAPRSVTVIVPAAR